MKHQTPELLKFRKLQRRLKIGKAHCVGLLELLWIETQRQAPRGDIGKFSNEDIAVLLEWEGDPDDLVAALVDYGWLDECSENRLIVHDWPEHAPRYVHGIVAKIGGFLSPRLQSPTIVPDCSPGLTPPSVDDCTRQQPNLTKPNLTKPNSFPTESLPGASPNGERSEPPSEFEFPISGKGSKTWTLSQAKLDEYAEAFPGLDVPAQLRLARQWCRDNPGKRKTSRGMLGFLTRWLSKAQNGGRAGPSSADATGGRADRSRAAAMRALADERGGIFG